MSTTPTSLSGDEWVEATAGQKEGASRFTSLATFVWVICARAAGDNFGNFIGAFGRRDLAAGFR